MSSKRPSSATESEHRPGNAGIRWIRSRMNRPGHRGPDIADAFAGCETAKRREPAGKGVCDREFREARGRILRSLYCCSESVRGRGAPATNLSRSVSFHSRERIAPSNRGIKHLGCSDCRRSWPTRASSSVKPFPRLRTLRGFGCPTFAAGFSGRRSLSTAHAKGDRTVDKYMSLTVFDECVAPCGRATPESLSSPTAAHRHASERCAGC